MAPSRPALRFAPSPNGSLHLGHALSALTTQRFARRLGGRLLLRLEDIDTTRSSDAFITGILEDLAWLGFDHEQPVLRQSEHFGTYRAALDRLDGRGLLYPCFATRREIAEAAGTSAPVDPDGAPRYPGLHRHLAPDDVARRKAEGAPYALRLRMDAAIAIAQELSDSPLSWQEVTADGTVTLRIADPALWGDVVIARKEVPASYHLAVVVDDARQGITHVTRGRDLEQATSVHRLLQVLLDLPEPIYHHHPLVLGDDGHKLSKSAGDTSLAELRRRGVTLADIRRRLGFEAT
jgi:glutamyl-Q tRNA(Asp) synthetase